MQASDALAARRGGLFVSREFSDCWAAQEAANAKLNSAFRGMCKKRATHESDLRGSSESLASTHDLKRKVCEAQENVLSHRERTRRFSNEHTRTEALVSDALNSHMPCKLRPKQTRPLCSPHRERKNICAKPQK